MDYINKNKIFAVILTSTLVLCFTNKERKIDSKQASGIFKSIAEWYRDTESFNVNIEFASFKSHQSTSPHEIKSGYLKKSGKKFHSSLMGLETVQNEFYKIIIDTATNTIAVKDAELSAWDEINPMIIQKGLTTSQSIFLDELEDRNILKMIPAKSSSINYYELDYDKNYRIQQVTLKMTKEALADDGKTTYKIAPKVHIRFYNYGKGNLIIANEFATSSYLNIQENTLKGVGKYANYKILDLRVKEKIKK